MGLEAGGRGGTKEEKEKEKEKEEKIPHRCESIGRRTVGFMGKQPILEEGI